MLIDDVISYIWGAKNEEYNRAYETYCKLDDTVLYKQLIKSKMGQVEYPGLTMNMLTTSGCSHQHKNGKLAGCSMCDYHSDFTQEHAAMAALREKNEELYVNVMCASFENARGKVVEPNVIEMISGYNSLDESEFPSSAYEKFYKENKHFSHSPFKYIIEVRASDVTKEKIDNIKECVGKKARVEIEFGVEVANEWIRNHWLNKDIYNADIINAIQIIHDAGYKVVADIIMGIPGLAEEQSVQLFKETVSWLNGIGADTIVCIPLNRKKLTLQGYIYNKFKHNHTLEKVGLVQGEHTGLPWMFTILNCFYEVLSEQPSVSKKLRISQLNPKQNSIKNTITYNNDSICPCYGNIIEFLQGFNKNYTADSVLEFIESIKEDPCMRKYSELIKKQKTAGTWIENIRFVSKEICKHIWPNHLEERMIQFNEELAQLREYS